MSIVSKQIFLKEIEEGLADTITVTQLKSVVDTLTNTLGVYEMERLQDEGHQQEFDDMLQVFVDAKRISGTSEKTIQRYTYILKKFRESCNTPIRHITVFDLRGFLMKEKARGVSDRTIEGYRDVFSSFFGWVTREGLLPQNPCGNLTTVKCRREVRLPFTDVDIEKLKECCQRTRDKALICFLLSTGCRISEVCGLNKSDVDILHKECRVLGKGNKERIVYMDDITAMMLTRYICERTDDCDALFVGKGDKRLLPNGVRTMLHQIAEKANVEDVHPHRFRRTLATNLINRGMPIQEVARILGHDKIDTTMTYVYINNERVKNSYQKCS